MRLALPAGTDVTELLTALLDGSSTTALLVRGVRTDGPLGALDDAVALPFVFGAAAALGGEAATNQARLRGHGAASRSSAGNGQPRRVR
jgi:hypothetical protein